MSKQVIHLGGGVQSVVAIEDDKLVTGTVQDCDWIVDNAKALHNEGIHGSADMRHIARLPVVVVEKYCNDNGIKLEEFMRDRTHIRRMVNDPDLSYFRIWPGAV